MAKPDGDVVGDGMTNNGKRPRRRYDDKFRASAVVMLEAAGYPEKEGVLMIVSRHLGMPHNTLRNWYHSVHNPPPSELRRDKKRELTEELRDIAYKLIGAIPGKIEDATLQQVSTSLGIVIDKMQLLSGQPTWRIEIVELVRNGQLTPSDVVEALGLAQAKALLEPAGIMVIEGSYVVSDSIEN